MSEEEKKPALDSAFLSKIAMKLAELPREEDIYRFVGKQVKSLVGEAVVIVSTLDIKSGLLKVEALISTKEQAKIFARHLRMEPVGRSLKINRKAERGLSKGKMVKVPADCTKFPSGE